MRKCSCKKPTRRLPTSTLVSRETARLEHLAAELSTRLRNLANAFNRIKIPLQELHAARVLLIEAQATLEKLEELDGKEGKQKRRRK